MTNIFIVGAQKAGTTALHSYLTSHSQISLSSKKELHFFDDDSIDWRYPNYERLERGLGRDTEGIRGEATPIYMYWPKSIERLYNYNSEAKLIILLRHPVFRAYSHWRMETMRGNENISFSDAIRSGRCRVKEAKNGVHRVYSYVERGFYAQQISYLLNYFSRAQLHFTTTEKLWLEPKSTLGYIEKFLHVREELNPMSEYIIAARTDMPEQITGTDKEFLMDLFSSDIRDVAKITGLNLHMWLDEKYQEPIYNSR